MESHTWVARDRCNCGFLWTTPGSPGVVCVCGATEIAGNATVCGGGVSFTEAEFKQAVADDLGVPVENIELLHEAP